MAIGGDVVAHLVAKVDADTSAMPNQIRRDMAKLGKAMSDDGDKSGTAWSRAFYKGVHREIKPNAGRAGIDFRTHFKASLRRSRADMDDLFEFDMSRSNRWIADFKKRFDLSDMLGSMFGKGSRNNFLNLMGSVASGIAGMGEGIVTGLMRVPDVVRGLVTNFQVFGDVVQDAFNRIGNAQGGMAKFGAALGEVGGGLAALAGPVGSAIAVVLALAAAVSLAGVVFLVLGEAVAVVVAALSQLAGGAVAVASALSFALIGVIGAAIPVMVGLAAAVGTVIIAFKNMSDAQKKSLEPLKKQFGEIGKEISKTFFKDLPMWLKTTSNLLKDFAGPLMQSVASNVRDAISGIARDFDSPIIKKALSSWKDALGPIAGDLTAALGKVLTGFVSFFQPLLPLARELAGAVRNAATAFSDWAASAGGQSAIKDFFTKAWEAAKSLWAILVNVGKAIGEVFSAGESSGQGFLTWLQDVTGKLAAFLKSPEGQNKLKQWFEDAVTFGKQLMEAVGKIGTALGKLDTEQNRAFATNLITAIGGIVEAVGKMGPAFEATGRAIAVMFGIAAEVFARLLYTISGIAGVMKGFFDVLGKVPAFDWARDIAKGLGEVQASAESAGQTLDNLPDEINMMFNGDDTDLQDAVMRTQEIDKTPDPVLTQFDGDTGQLSVAAAAAEVTVNGVPDSWKTDFLGDKNPVTVAAAAATGVVNAVPDGNTTTFAGEDSPLFGTVTQVNQAIGGVPDGNTTTFDGKDSGLGGAAKAASGAVNSVPDENTTYFDGNIAGITAAISRARAAIAGLMAATPGAMGNADLGQRAAGGIVGMAAGSVLRGPQVILAGEDGPEAIVPLRRSLARVDPAVRELSAIAQGLTPAGSGKNITIAPGAIQVTLPNTDPELAASALLDRFAILVN
jgi:hypothetical protein